MGIGLLKELDSFSILINNDIILCYDKKAENIVLKSYIFEKEYYCSICSKEKDIAFQKVRIIDLVSMMY